MNQRTTNIILLLVVLIGVAVGGYFVWQRFGVKKDNTPASVFQTMPGINVSVPKPNEAVSSPLKITGNVTGEGWTGFEGQVGTVKLLDKDGKELATTHLAATTEWTKLPTNFEATLTFTASSGSSGFLVFKNENASGDPIRDKTFILPITFK